MTNRTFRSIARFVMPLVGVGGFLLYLHIHEQPRADAALPKNVSSSLFQHDLVSNNGNGALEGDRPLLALPVDERLEPSHSQTPKQDSLDEPASPTIPEKQPPAPTAPPLGSTDILFQTTGTLEAGDEMLSSDQSLYDEHAFEGRAGQPVIITLESDDFDTYLILVSPDQRLLNENDDVSEANSDSSLTTILPMTGTYLAIANAFDSTGQGTYTLTVRAIVSSNRQLKDKLD
ncbi:MAG: hypothetical protein VKL39_18820 [Leptolyngbyaceae bacterium]|nr:hypothetical protein [Leptolyngbyaceae bacterium]